MINKTKPSHNDCIKVRDINNPYEIWKNDITEYEWRVLRKYEKPEKELLNPLAIWLVAITSPYTAEGLPDIKDEYIANIVRKKGSYKAK